MPSYVRTGMISHRHPFYGTSYMSGYMDWFDDEQKMAAAQAAAGSGSIWATEDEQAAGKTATAHPTEKATVKPLTQQSVAPTPDAPVAGKSPAWVLPALIGGAVLAFMLLKKK